MSTRESGGDDCRISLDHIATGIQIVQLLYNGQGEPADYLFLDVNAAYVEFSGFTKEEILGKKATELLPHREPGWLAKYGEAVKTGKTNRFEMFSQALGRWFDVIAIPLADQDALAILLTDISKPKGMKDIPRQRNERKAFFAKLVRETARRARTPVEQTRAQALLRESEAWLAGQKEAFQAAVGGAPLEASLGVLIRTAIEYAGNDVRCAFYISDPAKGELHHVVGMPETYAECVDGFRIGPDSLACGLAAHTGRPVITPDVTREPRWKPWLWLAERYEFRAVWSFPTQTLSGKVVGTLAVYHKSPREATARDHELAAVLTRAAAIIISQSQEMKERARSQEALRKSEAKYRKLFETANDGFWWGDKDGYVTEANEGIANMLGYRQEELIGRFWADFVEDEWLDQGYEAWEMRRSGRSGRYQIKLKKKDGSDLWAAISGTPLLDGENEYAGTLAAFNDITEQKLAQEELGRSEQKARALVKELEEADQNKNQFLSVLSHELRNPLAAISAGIQVLGIERDPRQIAKTHEIIHRQIDQLCRLVDDLLELTRINQNKIRLKKETIDLNEIVKCAVEDIRLEYQRKGVRLETEIQAKQIRLYADPARVTQAVGNLLQNALKFTPKDSSVLVTLRRESDDAVIVIRDEGIGIAPEILPQLFSPFTQAYGWEDRSHGGLGLGLSIVKGIVDLHEGTVSAYSEGLRKGAAFTVTLPVKTEGSLALERRIAAQSGKKGLKTLIVDDNRDFADLMSAMLTNLGYRVHIANDGEEGLQLARRIKPDMIFCDIGLPAMNGYRAAENIRKDVELNGVRLIALTGYANGETAERALGAGFDAYLAKPVDIAVLQRALESIS